MTLNSLDRSVHAPYARGMAKDDTKRPQQVFTLLMQRALDENAVIVAQMMPFDG